jgi:site-specific DNA-methyltransferase (adenine-specific)
MNWDIKLGDCKEIMPTISDNSVDMVLTDLPYGVVNRRSGGIRNFDKGRADICEIDLVWLCKEWDRVLKKSGASIYAFCGTEQVSLLRKSLVELGYSTRLLIWEKTNPSPVNGQYLWLSSVECCVFGRSKGAVFNEFCQSAVLRFPTCKSKFHPTQKPVPLLSRLIRASSNEGDTVLDNCMGIGSTGIACVQTNRNFIGVELCPEYFDKAKELLQKEQSKYKQTEMVYQ